MMSRDTIHKIGALAAYLNTLRPDWDVPGIGQALMRAAEAHQWKDVERASLAAARDQQARTPDSIGWAKYYPAQVNGDGYAFSSAGFCPRCRAVLVPAVAHDCHPSDWQQGVQQVRAAVSRRVKEGH